MAAEVAERVCGTCSLCCKILGIGTLNKPPGVWCEHCNLGKGCSIYENRPEECRAFSCQWLINSDFGDEWRPASSKMVLDYEPETNRITVHVDPNFSNNWRKRPYYQQLKDLALRAMCSQGQVCIRIGKRVIIVLPNEEVDMGEL